MYKQLIKPLLFSIDPETIHHRVFTLLETSFRLPGARAAARALYCVNDPRLRRNVFGIDFPNPVGLAAGFDKNAVLFNELANLGFGFIETGTLTPRSQPGNPRPRLFRLPEDQALINRMGFNNDGAEAALQRLKKKKPGLIIGGNIGKNKTTPNEEAVNDYLHCFHTLFDHVDYFVVNVSSPNTPGLRELQEKGPLTEILRALKEAGTNAGAGGNDAAGAGDVAAGAGGNDAAGAGGSDAAGAGGSAAGNTGAADDHAVANGNTGAGSSVAAGAGNAVAAGAGDAMAGPGGPAVSASGPARPGPETPKPILLKIAPDLSNSQLDDIIEIVKSTGIDGIIASNTTISREGLQTPERELSAIGAGGLSGRPLRRRATEVIRYLVEKSGTSFPVIGVGGIHSPQDALEKLEAGASLVQIYTGFIYEGPSLIKRINQAILKSTYR